MFQDDISNYITLPNEESYHDYDFESGRFRSDTSLGTLSDGDVYGSRKSSQPFDIIINDMQNELNEDMDYLIQKEIDSYIPTELDLLQNDDSESIDVDGFAINDSMMMDIRDDDMLIEGEAENTLNSDEHSSQTEERRINRHFNTVSDKEIELSNKKIQSNIDNVERLYDLDRLEMLLSPEKLVCFIKYPFAI